MHTKPQRLSNQGGAKTVLAQLATVNRDNPQFTALGAYGGTVPIHPSMPTLYILQSSQRLNSWRPRQARQPPTGQLGAAMPNSVRRWMEQSSRRRLTSLCAMLCPVPPHRCGTTTSAVTVAFPKRKIFPAGAAAECRLGCRQRASLALEQPPPNKQLKHGSRVRVGLHQYRHSRWRHQCCQCCIRCLRAPTAS